MLMHMGLYATGDYCSVLRFLRSSNSSWKRNTGCLDLYSDGAVLVKVIVEAVDIVTDGAD